MARPKLSLLPCGHFPSGTNPDGTPRCSICAEKAWLEQRAAERAAAEKERAARPVVPDPTPAPRDARRGATQTATTGATEPRKLLGDEPTAGVYGMDDADYHSDPLRAYGTESLSNSYGKLLLRPSTPAHYRVAVDESVKHVGRANLTDGKIFGSAFHAVTLGTGEPVPFKGASWKSKAAEDFLAECEYNDQLPVLARDLPAIRAMAEAVHTHEIASLALSNGQPEQAMFAQDPDTGVWLRAKVDWLNTRAKDTLVLVDLKSDADLPAPEVFGRTAGKWGYHRQSDFYPRVARLLKLAKRISMVFIVVEKTPPYSVVVQEPMAEDLRRAAALNTAAIEVFARCLQSGQWPGYEPIVHKFSLPGWVARDEEAVLEGIEE